MNLKLKHSGSFKKVWKIPFAFKIATVYPKSNCFKDLKFRCLHLISLSFDMIFYDFFKHNNNNNYKNNNNFLRLQKLNEFPERNKFLKDQSELPARNR